MNVLYNIQNIKLIKGDALLHFLMQKWIALKVKKIRKYVIFALISIKNQLLNSKNKQDLNKNKKDL